MSGKFHRRGFTLIEMLVAIAIIVSLTAILFPVFGRAREDARSPPMPKRLIACRAC